MNEKVRAWLKDNDYTPNTEESYGKYLSYVTGWASANGVSMAEFSPQDLQQFWEDEKPHWSKSSKHLSLCAVRGYCQFHFGNQHPLKQTNFKVKRPEKIQRTLSKEETLRLVASINPNTERGARDLAMVYVMLDTGLRASEVCRMKLKNLILQDERGPRFKVITKNGDEQMKLVSPRTAEVLTDWLTRFRPFIADKKLPYVFCSVGGLTPGANLTKDGLRSIFSVMGRDAKIDGLSPHVLRRTAAVFHRMNGQADSNIIDLFGWKSPAMLKRYTKAFRLQHQQFEGKWPTGVIEEHRMPTLMEVLENAKAA